MTCLSCLTCTCVWSNSMWPMPCLATLLLQYWSLGMRTVPSDGYGRPFDGHLTGTAHPSTVRPVKLAAGQWVRDGDGDGRCTVYGLYTVVKYYILCIIFTINYRK
jgi:hypothetical protein